MKISENSDRLLLNREFWIKKGKKFLGKESLSIPDVYLNRRENRVLRRKINPYGSLSVLDLGCANGFSTFAINRPGTNYVCGIDSNAKFIDFAKNSVKERNESAIEFIIGDVTSLPFQDSSYDIAYAKRTLMNVPSRQLQQRAIEEAARVLREGGTFFVSDLFEEGFERLNALRQKIGFKPFPYPNHLLFMTKEDLMDMTKKDFKLVKEEDFTSGYYLLSKVFTPSLTTSKSPLLGRLYASLPSFGRLEINKLYTFRRI